MLRSPAAAATRKGAFAIPGAMLALAALVLVALTFAEWRAMAHQWWNIDPYSHILLVPPIIAWLGWIRRDELARAGLRGWWPGLAWLDPSSKFTTMQYSSPFSESRVPGRTATQFGADRRIVISE